jgi:hypothetical protein
VVYPLSFLLFPDAPSASLSIPHLTLSSSVSSSESPLVIPEYTVKLPVTQFYSRRGARSSDAPTSSDELSADVSSSSLDVPSSLIDSSSEQIVRRGHQNLSHCQKKCLINTSYFVAHSSSL